MELYGNTVTVSGLVRPDGGTIENTEREAGVGNSLLIVNNATDCLYNGMIRNNYGGSGVVALTKTGAGKLTLAGASGYTGSTTISGGVLEANSVWGVPTASFLILDGGVLQSTGTTTVAFTRSLAASGSGNFQMTGNGGGFSAGSSALNVNIGNGRHLSLGALPSARKSSALSSSAPRRQ